MPRSLLCPTLAALALVLASAAVASPQSLSLPPTPEARQKMAAELDAYLWKHVLKPRFPACVDKEHGGFHSNYARGWSPLEDRSRFIVYEARVVWTAATVALLRPDTREEYLPCVHHGVRYLADVMWNREHGGFHTLVDLSGRGLTGEFAGRPVYGQAFAIYGLAAAHAATLRGRAARAREARLALGRGPLPRRPRARVPQRGEAGRPAVPGSEGRGARRSRVDRRPRPPPHDERPHPHPRGVRGTAAVLAGPGAAEAHRGAARLRPRPVVRRAGLPTSPCGRTGASSPRRSRSDTTWRRPS